uniref:Major facilitator superfamily (MFS) profile domain-containing protein n=1 Tax=Phaeomonas parva TaxID=124430 RepID=A0A7S1XX30_9STRA|mmetsp:Transcript_41401/g.129674  ORF Transcript_41401/g.129674 Transcript_41401/m.129674 type:complete len:476 (+) Transcript_41401:108-1535(+)
MQRAGLLFGLYFFFIAFRGRFMALYYEENGLSDSQIGTLLGVASLIQLFAAPFASKIADRYNSHALVSLVCNGATIVFFLAQIIALPSVSPMLSRDQRFALLFVLRCFDSAFIAPTYPLLTAMCIAALRREHGECGHTKFGQKRLWGAVGWAVGSLMLGLLLDLAGAWIVHPCVLISGLGFVIALYIWAENPNPKPSANAKSGYATVRVDSGDSDEPSDASDEENNEDVSFLAVLRILLGPPGGDAEPKPKASPARLKVLLFLVLTFLLGAVMSTVENLLFLFFGDDLHASNFVCGLSVVVTVVFEIPILAYAPRLLELAGTTNLMIVATTAFAIRGVGYTLASNGYWVLLCEPLHGVTYACAHTASVAFFAERMPQRLEASAQGILSSLTGMGMFVGTIAGGFVLDAFGSAVLYRGAAVLIMVATSAFMLSDQIEVAMRRCLGVAGGGVTGLGAYKRVPSHTDDFVEEGGDVVL